MIKGIRLLIATALSAGLLVGQANPTGAGSGPSRTSDTAARVAASTAVSVQPAVTRKVALGVSNIDDRSIAAVDAFTSSVGRAPAIWTVWSSWGGPDKAFPTAFFNQLHTRAITPLVIWQPVNPANVDDFHWSNKKIIHGDYDAYIRAWAQKAKNWGHTVLLRFAHEMNGYWFPWSPGRFDNTLTSFKNMWKHVWNIFRGPGGVGASNVKFVWSPNAPCARCNSYASVFPGNAYIDYAGITGFNWGDPPRNWRSMVNSFKPGMQPLRGLTTKPVIVAEMGSSSLGGSKPAWIRDGYPAAYTAYPQIKAIVYFDVDLTSVKQPDWRLTTPTGSLLAYANIVAKPKFQGTIP